MPTQEQTTVDDFMDPFNSEIGQCPAPHLARLRQEHPIYKVPGRPLYLVTRYEDCTTINLDNDSFVNTHHGFEEPLAAVGFLPNDPDVNELFASSVCPGAPVLRTADQPDHSRSRRAVAEWFNARRISERYGDMIRRRATDLIAGFPAHGEVEFMEAFAVPLPVGVIAEILGVPDDRLGDFKRWSDEWIAAVGKDLTRAEWMRKAKAKVELDAFFLEEVERRLRQPSDDLLGDLARATTDPGAAYKLTVPEVVSVAEQLLVGGNETTTQILGEIVRLLATHPHELSKVVGDRSLIPNVVEEALRIGSPIKGLYKNCKADVTVNGTLIPAGSVVALMWGSANRDSAMFDEPDRFSADRPNARRHVAFGIGAHLCLGAPLTRLEVAIALELLLAKYSTISLAQDFVHDRGDSFLMDGMRELPVAFA